jgi:hypothetical protein
MSTGSSTGQNSRGVSTFTVTRKDRTLKNQRTGENLQVPVYSEEPDVSQGGQFYWNSNTKVMNYSNGEAWVPMLADVVAGNLKVEGDTTLTGGLLLNCERTVGPPDTIVSARIGGNASDSIIATVQSATSVDSFSYTTGIYNNPRANVYNPDGSIANVLATSSSRSTFVVKRDSEMNAVWSANIQDFFSQDISAVSDAVYVSGVYSGMFISFNTDGTVGNVIPSGIGGFNGYVVKYNDSGVSQWVANVVGPGTDQVFGVSAVSDAVYGAGSFRFSADVYNSDGTIANTLTSPDTNSTSWIAKWNSDGQVLWAANNTDNTPVNINRYDDVSSVSDGVYASGRFVDMINIFNSDGTLANTLSGISTLNSNYIVKYDSSGTVEWAANIVPDISTVITAPVVSADSDGVYIAGSYQGNLVVNNADYTVGKNFPGDSQTSGYLIRYDNSGNVVWGVNIPADLGFLSIRITSDDDSVFVRGSFANTVTLLNSDNSLFRKITDPGNIVIKYDSNGFVQYATIGEEEALYTISISEDRLYYSGTVNTTNPTITFYNQSQDSTTVLPEFEKQGVLTLSFDDFSGQTEFIQKNANAVTQFNADLTVDGNLILDNVVTTANTDPVTPVARLLINVNGTDHKIPLEAI